MLISGMAARWAERNYQLRLHEQLGWATGSMGTGVMIGALTGYGLYYMTNYLGIAAGLAGVLIGLSKFYDMISDPIMGQISDRTRAKWGRRRPYLLVGTIACPLALLALFHMPTFESSTLTIALLFTVLLLYATAFTSFNVPYFAMPAEMTSHYHERTVIMSQRVFFSTMSVVSISVLGPYVIEWFGGGVAGYRGMSWVMAVIVFISMGATFYLTRNVAFTKRSERGDYTVRNQARLILSNKPFCTFVVAKSLIFIGSASAQGTLLFMGRFVLDRGEKILVGFGVGYTIGVTMSLPIWTYLIGKVLDKRNAFRIASIGLGLTMMTWWFATPGESLVIFYLRFFLLGVFSAGGLVSGSAMLPDMMEYDRHRSGVSQEGLYAATFSLIEKIAYTAGPAMLGLLLGAAGFISVEKGQFVDQPDSAVTAIRVAVSIIPAVLSIIGGLLIGFYDLDEAKLKSAQSNSVRPTE
jgi:GPH family glycoside/pentoside/hexuronide:cation symporter